MLVPGAAVLKAQHAAQTWRPSSRSTSSPGRPTRGRAAGGGARSRGTHRSVAGRSLAPRSSPSGSRTLASFSDRQPSAGSLLAGHWQASGGRMHRPQRACFACHQATRRPHPQRCWRCRTATWGITRPAWPQPRRAETQGRQPAIATFPVVIVVETGNDPSALRGSLGSFVWLARPGQGSVGVWWPGRAVTAVLAPDALAS
jgi:hypothetical protein